ncbi:Cutinase transcription factor 1 beta [Lecanosticta acicola]|uniref:Cutinase transcription factor 1 beta n=1 Tax=Lecanosticta acicola TaxID=111012 RepID=A0AAI9E9N4_9PEZI|nr:Cutinase transcription factor 1 beta [Lecanosticta acicola]
MGDMCSMAMDTQLSSDASSSPPDTTDLHTQASTTNKRTAADAGLKANGVRPAKSVKRRASKACQCCRARKVRCNVVEQGPPCTNCRLDEVECIVSESKRKKKWSTGGNESSPHPTKGGLPFKAPMFPMSAQPPYEPLKRIEHVPHALYQDLGRDISLTNNTARSSMYTPDMMMNLQRMGPKPSIPDPTPLHPSLVTPTMPAYSLPMYIKPLPSKLNPEDILYLEKKGALAIPSQQLRNELLRNFVEFVHPNMPLLDVHDLVTSIDRDDGAAPVSLLLLQAIMFSAIATVDIRHLKAAGYTTRRDARRDFFQKTRLLYDFDVEIDRISLIQSLLLMSYWYETPDDQKDSHHWMGIAVSLSHTIGLHRNPEKSTAMDEPRKKLWKRIWWCTYMRDRLVALGMRRPTRIKTADFDVPMLNISDFESAVLPGGPSCIPADCKVLRDLDTQRQLAIMCIESAKLCVCMSHVLSVQYSVLNNNHGVVNDEGSTKTTVRLVAKKLEPRVNEVQTCDKELQEWRDELPKEALYVPPTWHDVDAGNESIVLNRSLLHMISYATLSALHRPQVLPSTAMPPRQMQSDMLDLSRKAVRLAAGEITSIAYNLFNLDMVRFLPTTGITVLLPAIIIHLLDIKAPDEATRRSSLQGFCQCMQIMGKLRDMYAAADYSTAFLEAAIRKAEITLPQKSDEVKEPRNVITSTQGLVDAGRRLRLVSAAPDPGALTPPPDDASRQQPQHQRDGSPLTDDDIAQKLNSYLASTPPDSEGQNFGDHSDLHGLPIPPPESEPDFESLINLDAAADVWGLEDGAYAAMSGESGGFTMDMDWLKGMSSDGLDPATTAAAAAMAATAPA